MTDGAGHVAIVEEINNDGSIRCSNSAWQSTYFWISDITPVNNKYDWSHYSFQGFIYNPFSDIPTPPYTKIRKKFPWAIFTNKIKRRRLTI